MIIDRPSSSVHPQPEERYFADPFADTVTQPGNHGAEHSTLIPQPSLKTLSARSSWQKPQEATYQRISGEMYSSYAESIVRAGAELPKPVYLEFRKMLGPAIRVHVPSLTFAKGMLKMRVALNLCAHPPKTALRARISNKPFVYDVLSTVPFRLGKERREPTDANLEMSFICALRDAKTIDYEQLINECTRRLNLKELAYSDLDKPLHCFLETKDVIQQAIFDLYGLQFHAGSGKFIRAEAPPKPAYADLQFYEDGMLTKIRT